MEPQEVRLARLEEAMVGVKGDTRYIRTKLDTIAEGHWHFSGKVLGFAIGSSMVTSLLTTVALRLIMKG